MLVPGGFGTRGIEGKIMACKWARENNVPFLGGYNINVHLTCFFLIYSFLFFHDTLLSYRMYNVVARTVRC